MLENTKDWFSILTEELLREEIKAKRKEACDRLFLLQVNYHEKSQKEQKMLDVEIRKIGMELEKLVLPRKPISYLYHKDYIVTENERND